MVPGTRVGIDNAGVEASDQSGGCGWIDGFAIRVDPMVKLMSSESVAVMVGCEGDRDGVGGVDVVEEDGGGWSLGF